MLLKMRLLPPLMDKEIAVQPQNRSIVYLPLFLEANEGDVVRMLKGIGVDYEEGYSIDSLLPFTELLEAPPGSESLAMKNNLKKDLD